MIKLTNVHKKYHIGAKELHVLKGISVEIPAGQYVSIVGKSGSGKSTLMHLTGGLDRPDTGSVLLDGDELTTMNDQQLTLVRRRKVGFIFQFFNLMPNLSVLENTVLPALLDGKKLPELRDRAEHLLGEVGLGERMDHKPDQLSGGEMQRTAIARALLYDPPIILADEPTGNLDSKTGDAILALIKNAHVTYGKTILLVTHDPRAAATAERKLTISDGNIIADEMLAEAVA